MSQKPDKRSKYEVETDEELNIGKYLSIVKLRRLAVVSCIAVQTIMQTAAECCPLLTSSRAMPRAVWIIPRYLTGAWPP